MLGLHVAGGDPIVLGVLTKLKAYFAAHGAAEAQPRAVGTLAGLVARQANTLSYLDGFWLTFWFGIVAVLCAACISPAPPGPFTPKRVAS